MSDSLEKSAVSEAWIKAMVQRSKASLPGFVHARDKHYGIADEILRDVRRQGTTLSERQQDKRWLAGAAANGELRQRMLREERPIYADSILELPTSPNPTHAKLDITRGMFGNKQTLPLESPAPIPGWKVQPPDPRLPAPALDVDPLHLGATKTAVSDAWIKAMIQRADASLPRLAKFKTRLSTNHSNTRDKLDDLIWSRPRNTGIAQEERTLGKHLDKFETAIDATSNRENEIASVVHDALEDKGIFPGERFRTLRDGFNDYMKPHGYGMDPKYFDAVARDVHRTTGINVESPFPGTKVPIPGWKNKTAKAMFPAFLGAALPGDKLAADLKTLRAAVDRFPNLRTSVPRELAGSAPGMGSAAMMVPREKNYLRLNRRLDETAAGLANEALANAKTPKQFESAANYQEMARRGGEQRAAFGKKIGPLGGTIFLPPDAGKGTIEAIRRMGVRIPAKTNPEDIRTLSGIHEGFERRVRPSSYAPFHSHLSPDVLLQEHNMLTKLTGQGSDPARQTFQRFRDVTSEGADLSNLLRSAYGDRMNFAYGSSERIPRAMRRNLQRRLDQGQLTARQGTKYMPPEMLEGMQAADKLPLTSTLNDQLKEVYALGKSPRYR